MKDKKPKYMMVYRCATCKMESGYTEQDQPMCRYCDEPTTMELVSKQELSPEVIAERLGKLSENMFSNLQSAYEGITEDDKTLFDEEDPEKLMLTLLAKAKKLKEDIGALGLEDTEGKSDDVEDEN